ncbi:hypothetical protein FE257_003133 [Aspergillus nanangensis]|uniref:RING-type domain-containing protein n=1 Tax=Aspergillus nanangensis TaxID=2582783 RepID=A0AAD4CBY4_ASPNN|nr:hypothetical protein FE257_003133 [Aspergillus nanangensis]
MAADPQSGPGLRDLEKELTCSICTELLYQPLTLLDCLHTYCGSCLKEWFLAQASRRRTSSSVRFTCPACRAVVRETRPNATVTTLLDMVLAANPDRSKPGVEKEEIAQRYKHGESIFPNLPLSESDVRQSDEDDRRLLEEVRELSLRETGAQTSDTSRRARRSSRTRRAESVDGNGRSARRQREEERAVRRQTRGVRSGGSTENTRQVEHQSSLRSLLSLSDPESMEEEILRQILEEGLLEDIDLDNLGPSEEEELSERIADAYRRRHLRSRSQQRPEDSARPSGDPGARSQSVQRTAPSSTAHSSSGNPPVSRPYLLDPLMPRTGQSGHHRRLSDQGSNRRRTSPAPNTPASSSDVNLRPTVRSSSDMAADRPRNSHSPRVRAAGTGTSRLRRATESEQAISNIWADARRQRSGRQSTDSSVIVTSPVEGSGRNGSFSARSEQIATSPTTSSLVPEVGGSNRQNGRSRPSSSRSTASQRSAPFIEPSVSCDRCGKQNIQYDLHKRCPCCNNGDYNLCLRCYRLGYGCLNWCNDGDYDICANCYLKLVATSKIRKENGHNGWRRCLKGHRMVVVGFEDHEDVQRRVIVQDLVGGRALKDEHLYPSASSASSPNTPPPSTVRSFDTGRGNIASPEVGSGDWSWKEGSERRKKASRARNPADRDRSSPLSPSEPSTPVGTNSMSARQYPPDGGVGLVLHALWSYYPEDEVTDELMFPRGADITEAENINEDWYWGCYAGSTGLFPGGHVFVEEDIV